MPPKRSEAVLASPLFKELCKSVAKETREFTFSCGGSIPIVPELPSSEYVVKPSWVLRSVTRQPSPFFDKPSTEMWRRKDPTLTDPASDDFDEPPVRSSLSLPVDLRWDSKDAFSLSQQTKISFPLMPETRFNLTKLVDDCEPATFGRGAQDVYDESYRKASKMDPSQFSTTFNPYEVGIVDTIAQTLLPTLRHSQQTRAVKAELYKLNFYSAPSGKFKPHVDTPRSPDQFGSLVVCLPVAHQGGALEVRHNGKTVTFDWSSPAENSAEASINWAAFYSDCEHEVFEVTEGHRLTLTYNLYIVRGNGFLGGHSPALDPATLPLYKTISDLVHDTTLWKEGGYIGYHCSHIYPHTAKTKLHFMVPDNLKGSDMAMFAILCSLGLEVSFRPAFEHDDLGHEQYDSDTEKTEWGYEGTEEWTLGADGRLKWEEWYGGENGNYNDFNTWIGKHKFKGEEVVNPGDIWQYKRKAFERVPSYLRYKDVHWVNEFGHKENQVTYLAAHYDE
ncbi:hypothetical protein SLS53_009218 [Cytospora paraplurivora]|uniref:Fe2OG dioxygenase domain-containing protein n=1 Tax=Cytospora paraplurivora TaxID=2898453 RepID=A0AAN9YC08_9PEZI